MTLGGALPAKSHISCYRSGQHRRTWRWRPLPGPIAISIERCRRPPSLELAVLGVFSWLRYLWELTVPTKKILKSAVTGKFVSKTAIKKDPARTFVETVKVKPKKAAAKKPKP